MMATMLRVKEMDLFFCMLNVSETDKDVLNSGMMLFIDCGFISAVYKIHGYCPLVLCIDIATVGAGHIVFH